MSQYIFFFFLKEGKKCTVHVPLNYPAHHKHNLRISWEPNSLLSGRMRQPKRANKLHALRFIASRGSCRSTPSCLQPPPSSHLPVQPLPHHPFLSSAPSSSFLDPPITFLHSKRVRRSAARRHPRLYVQQVTSNTSVLQSSVLSELKVTLKLMERSFFCSLDLYDGSPCTRWNTGGHVNAENKGFGKVSQHILFIRKMHFGNKPGQTTWLEV